jgi:hypothetical protein
MLAATRFLDNRSRVERGRHREEQLIEALRKQHSLALKPPTEAQDKEQKIDCFLEADGKKIAVQIKYRETGDDVLVEVYDRWLGWDNQNNKAGRDMIGKAERYVVLRQDRKSVVMTETAIIKQLVYRMVNSAKANGWTEDKGEQQKTLRYHLPGGKCELKVQRDPHDGRTKMMAYIPATVFTMQYHAQTFKVNMPETW